MESGGIYVGTVLGEYRCVLGLELDQLEFLTCTQPRMRRCFSCVWPCREARRPGWTHIRMDACPFFFVPVRGYSRHIYSCVLAFLPYLKLQPEVGSESVGISSQLIGAVPTLLRTQPHSVLFFLFWGV